jgi:addiction module RelE/StbE family toxin
VSYAVVFSAEAERDLAAIADYIGQDNPRRARTFTDELQAFVTEKLSTFPASGPEIGSRRYVVFGNHVILYQMDEATSIVLVQVIVEGHRNWRKAYGSSA